MINEKKMSGLDKAQLALDGVGLIPGIGELADGLNGIISIGRGDLTGAGLSFISMVPGIGDAIGKGGKVGRAILKNKTVQKASAAGAEKAAKAAVKKPSVAKKLKSAGEKMSAAKNAIVKKAGDIKDIHKAVMGKDLAALEKKFGKKIPDEYRDGLQKALDVASDKLKDVDLKKDVLGKIEATAKAGEEVKKATDKKGDDSKESVKESLRYDLFYRTISEEQVNEIWEDLGNTLNEQRKYYKE
mgnify:CR=1 FL=1